MIIVDRPWNDTEEFPDFVQRVGSWREEKYGWEDIDVILKDIQKYKI